MDFGLYEKLLDSEVKNQISELYNETRKVDKSESAKVLATAYYKILRKILSEKKEEEKIDFVRKLNKEIGNEILFEDDKNFLELLALHEDKDILKKLIDDRPKTSISSSTLFTGYMGPTLESELRREIRTADRIDFIVSFIKYSGLVLIYDDLVEFTKNKKLRIITTSYMGASDYKAILKLSQLPNTEVKISYDTNRTRLHAKAYYFERNTGFSTAYIGSSNLSNPALSKGLEWNLKVSEYTSKDVVDSIIKTFETYWNDEEFRTFSPGDEEDKKELKVALSRREKDEDKKYVFFDLRPYSHQKEILEDLRLEREEYGPNKNLVIAATGSGKTITSFKTALFLSTRGGFDKVIFLVDRRELDKKTSENFKAYASYEPVTVDDTKHTYHLRKQLLSVKKGIIVTTTYKLSNLVKDLVDAQDYDLSKKRLIFIIDEAHRTTMGEMMVNIKSYFKKNSLFYGYTGTPLFDENQVTGMVNQKSEVIDTTKKLFGPELHKYTIDQAIADGNVLGFHVDYINTGEFLSYEDLRDQIKVQIELEKPEMSTREIERLVQGWSDLEVEKEAKKRKLIIYQDETHVPRVVEEIVSNWEVQSQERYFNGILTVAYKERVVAYYNEFKRQLEGQEDTINIAMTFSFGNENEAENIPSEIIEGMFKDYSEFTGIEFTYGDRKKGEEAYFEDIVARGTRGGSGRNKKNVDLIIVADQLLTGYDSKFLNTLYVDRSLELQGLIQAYSRTNRIYGKNKEFGTIVNFQYPKITEERVDTALKLYGSGGTSSKVIIEHYVIAVEKFSLKAEEMVKTLPNPTDWEELKTNDEMKQLYVLSFKDANEQLRLVMQYYEFKWDDDSFGIDEHTWLKYVGAYRNLIFKDDQTPEDELVIPLVGKTKLSGTQVIDANHILSLIGSKVKTDKGVQTVDRETLRIIYEEIQELSDMGEDEQAKLLKEFVETELVPGNLSSNFSFDELFDGWKQEKVEKEVKRFAQDWGVDESYLSKSVEHFSLVREDVIPYITELSESVDFSKAKKQDAKNRLEHNMEFVNKALPEWLVEVEKKYN